MRRRQNREPAMNLTFEDFVARSSELDAQTDDGSSLALYAYAGGQRPPVDALQHHVWQRAIETADLACGRVFPLSEWDRARAEATMLGLPIDESAQLPSPETPDDERDEDDPATMVGTTGAVVISMEEPPTEAGVDELRQELALEGIEAATVESEGWASASDRLHAWYAEVLDKLAKRQ